MANLQSKLHVVCLPDHGDRRTSYERLFNQWGLRKNRKGADWYWVGHRVKQRQNEGRRSALYINKQRIPDHVVRKEVSRHVSALEEVWLGSESGEKFFKRIAFILTSTAPSSPIGYEIMTPASTASPTASGPTTSISDDIFISQSQLLATAQQKMQPHRYQEPEASQTHNAQICCQNEFQRCDIRDKDMIVTMLEDCSLFITLCARHHNNTFHEQFRELCEALAIEILATLQKSAEYVVPLDKIYFRKEFSILPQSYNGNEEAIRASKATFDTDEYKDIFRAALFLAAAKGILAIVKVLYPVFVNSETGDSKQQTCSYIASINNQPHVVEFLLEKSANVNARSRDGRFPRTIICGPAGREEISQVLIAAGAHLNDKQPEDRMNALYDAAAEGRVECMRAMLRKRAESSYRIPFEWAPLVSGRRLHTMEGSLIML